MYMRVTGGTLRYFKSSQDNSKNACHMSLKSCAEMISLRVHLGSPVFFFLGTGCDYLLSCKFIFSVLDPQQTLKLVLGNTSLGKK